MALYNNQNLLGLAIFIFFVGLVLGELLLVVIAVTLLIISLNKPFHMTNVHYQDYSSWLSHHLFSKKKLATFVGFILLLILLYNMVAIIPAGKTGVYHLFGKVRDKELTSGFHLINPLAEVQLMTIRTEQYTMTSIVGEGQRSDDDSIDALTKEGLKVSLDMTVLYHLNEESASEVFKTLGMFYEEKIIRPGVRSAIREVVALYEAKDIYSDKRDDVTKGIFEILTRNINPRGINIETVLIRNVALPELLTGAIEEKLAAEQEAQKYDFILQKEEKEAERKRIEAKGQRDAQSTINESLTERYLQFLYIRELKDREGTIYVPTNLPLFRNL